MTRQEALSKLKGLHGEVTEIEPTLFAAQIDRKWVLFRLRGDILEQRFDDEVHSCIWEPVD